MRDLETESNQGLATDHVKVNGDHFEVDDVHYKVDGNHCKLDGNHFEVSRDHFKVDGAHFKVDGAYYNVDVDHFEVEGYHFQVDDNKCSVVTPRPGPRKKTSLGENLVESHAYNPIRDSGEDSTWLLARLFALSKHFTESLGSDYMHDFLQDSLRDLFFFYVGDSFKSLYTERRSGKKSPTSIAKTAKTTWYTSATITEI